MSTFCPQLWDGCYINRNGEVFACCHLRPVPYGNIHERTLRDLVNAPEAIRSRKSSLDGNLGCYSNCNLFDKGPARRSADEESVIDYSRLRRLHLSFGEACNIRCVMCNHPQRHAKNPIFLEPEVLVRNVDFAPFKTIIIQGGEPLFIRQCLDFMAHLETIGKKYTILTNGLLIDDRMAARLAQHAHRVNISVNGATKKGHESVNRGSRFERVIENVQRIRKARAKLESTVVLTGHMTITVSNVHEVPLFLRTFRSLGFDRVNFGYVQETVPQFLAGNPVLRDQLRSETSAALAEHGSSDIDTLRLGMLGLLNPAAELRTVLAVPPKLLSISPVAS